MKFNFERALKPVEISESDWGNWSWQLRNSLKSQAEFSRVFELCKEEIEAFSNAKDIFNIRSTPYYASLASKTNVYDPIRRILMPHKFELAQESQAQLDPLGEIKSENRVAKRLVHRYSDRVLFLVTDICSVYCRYCTRKHFTGAEQAFIKNSEYDEAIKYIKSRPGIREVILSGGDPLTISDSQLERVLFDLRQIDHVEIVRIGTRIPVVAPMRVTEDLIKNLRKYKPVFLMTHFNHPRELTLEAAEAVERFVDNGIPVMNQMVLLNGVNNHAAVVQALSRRLLFLRAKPYYMFQCDPSIGTDYLRTTVESSLEIQRELWGHMSGLAMPNLSLDIPHGGGKAGYVPNFEISSVDGVRKFRGWDGIESEYVNPPIEIQIRPFDFETYLEEWNQVKSAKTLIND